MMDEIDTMLSDLRARVADLTTARNLATDQLAIANDMSARQAMIIARQAEQIGALTLERDQAQAAIAEAERAVDATTDAATDATAEMSEVVRNRGDVIEKQAAVLAARNDEIGRLQARTRALTETLSATETAFQATVLGRRNLESDLAECREARTEIEGRLQRIAATLPAICGPGGVLDVLSKRPEDVGPCAIGDAVVVATLRGAAARIAAECSGYEQPSECGHAAEVTPEPHPIEVLANRWRDVRTRATSAYALAWFGLHDAMAAEVVRLSRMFPPPPTA